MKYFNLFSQATREYKDEMAPVALEPRVADRWRRSSQPLKTNVFRKVEGAHIPTVSVNLGSHRNLLLW